MLKPTSSAVVALLLGLGLTTTAQAQSRIFVAAQGLDSNPCNFAAPCRTFQHAHDVATPGGEIDVLDPAGYGSLIITKAISIQGHGFSGISTASGDAIVINAPTNDKVNLRGLLIDGVGTGTNGITFNTGAVLNIQDCLIRKFLGSGIRFVPSATSKLAVSNTLVADIRDGGILIEPTGSGTVLGVIDHTTTEAIYGSATVAIFVVGSSSTGTVDVTITDSVVALNA